MRTTVTIFLSPGYDQCLRRSGAISGNQTLNFTAAVTSAAAGTSATPSGTVQFYANGVPTGTAQSLNNSGLATYTVASSTLPLGAVEITATYTGDKYLRGLELRAVVADLESQRHRDGYLDAVCSAYERRPHHALRLDGDLRGNRIECCPYRPDQSLCRRRRIAGAAVSADTELQQTHLHRQRTGRRNAHLSGELPGRQHLCSRRFHSSGGDDQCLADDHHAERPG